MLVGQEASDATSAGAGLREITTRIKKLAAAVREMSLELHPTVLDDLGLVEAIKSECHKFSDRCGIAIECSIDIPSDTIPEEIAIPLFRILQEALKNTEKHSQALDVRVSLTQVGSDVRRERHILVATLVFFIPALTARWISEFFDSTQSLATVVAQSLLAIYLLFIAVVVLFAVLGHEKVTPQTVGGAVCVYLLIAFVFACLNGIVEFSAPGSIDFSGTRIGADNPSMENTAFPRLLYFSFVTLTTLGYGDILPVSGAARSLTISETLAGQLFLAAFIARLVGSMIATRRSSN